MHMTTPAPNPYFEPVHAGSDRAEALENTIAVCAGQGWRLQSTYGGIATMVSGQPINHVLHALLSIFTLGLWLPFWLLVVATNSGEKRLTIIADHDGNIRYEQGR